LDQLYSTSTRTPSSEIYSDYSSKTDIFRNTVTSVKKLFPFKPTLNYTPSSFTLVQQNGKMSPLINRSSVKNDLIETTELPILNRNSTPDKSNSTFFFLLSSISIKTSTLSKAESITILDNNGDNTPLLKNSLINNFFFTRSQQTLTRDYSDMNISKQYTLEINKTIEYDTSVMPTLSDNLVSYQTTETPETSTLINHNKSHQIIQSTSYLG
jgi:hypothetical protein